MPKAGVGHSPCTWEVLYQHSWQPKPNHPEPPHPQPLSAARDGPATAHVARTRSWRRSSASPRRGRGHVDATSGSEGSGRSCEKHRADEARDHMVFGKKSIPRNQGATGSSVTLSQTLHGTAIYASNHPPKHPKPQRSQALEVQFDNIFDRLK